jgi:hypothetical protein
MRSANRVVPTRASPAPPRQANGTAPATPVQAAGPVIRPAIGQLAATPPATLPIQRAKKPSLRTRVAEKLRQANATGTAPTIAPREARLVPELARSPRAGFTPELLARQKAALRRVDDLPLNHDLPSLHVERRAHEHAGTYTDLVADARSSTARLRSQPEGNRLLTELNTRAGQNAATIGPQARVAIRSTLPTDTTNINTPLIEGSSHAEVAQGYRFDQAEGTGRGSEVRINPNQPSANRFIGLGHELVHSHRQAHGRAVGVPQLNQAAHPLFNDPASLGADVGNSRGFGAHLTDVASHHNQLQEEFETVGLRPTPRAATSPTENALRAEHGLPARGDYSGARPGSTDGLIRDSDAPFDRRNWWQRNVSGVAAPTPFSDMLRRYNR